MNSDLGKKNIEAMEALVEQMTAEGDYLNPKVQKEEKKKAEKKEEDKDDKKDTK